MCSKGLLNVCSFKKKPSENMWGRSPLLFCIYGKEDRKRRTEKGTERKLNNFHTFLHLNVSFHTTF